jgi:hypothetical protein
MEISPLDQPGLRDIRKLKFPQLVREKDAKGIASRGIIARRKQTRSLRVFAAQNFLAACGGF